MSKTTPTPVYFEAEAIRNAREYAGDAARRAKEKDTQIEAQAAEITRLRAENARLREAIEMVIDCIENRDVIGASLTLTKALGETQ